MNKKSSNTANFPIIFQSLYLSNLLLIPAFSFFVLLYFLYQYKKQALTANVKTTTKVKFSRKAKIHLYRSIQLSLVAGVMLGIIPLITVLISSQFQASIMVMIIYFVTLHAGFVLIGMFNLSRAMAKKLPIF
ncbi:MAG: hypothetical protein OCD00_03515 [Colwellia sp.]